MQPAAKLTLSVNTRVIERATRHARARGTSVSQLVEAFLRAATAPIPAAEAPPPILGRLRGSLRRGRLEDYRRALARKHRRGAGVN
jgi:hypothetical protein